MIKRLFFAAVILTFGMPALLCGAQGNPWDIPAMQVSDNVCLTGQCALRTPIRSVVHAAASVASIPYRAAAIIPHMPYRAVASPVNYVTSQPSPVVTYYVPHEVKYQTARRVRFVSFRSFGCRR